ncbi:MAG: hypothetical protein ACK46O_13965 [Flavobacteriia bacterium]
MFARYFFITLGIISVLWVGYVAADIIDKKKSFSPTSLFGKEDGKILVINRRYEVDETKLPFKTIAKNNEILSVLKPNLTDERSIYISANRRQFLIESKFNWSEGKVEELLKKSGLNAKTLGLRSYAISGFDIKYYKNYLHFAAPELETTLIEGWGNFDRRSSASVIDLNEDLPKITDIYFKGDDRVDFETKNFKKLKGDQVDDNALFSSALPKNIKNYHFIEKQFLNASDKIFANGPMKNWVDKGIVTFEYKGSKVIVTDFVSGQEPVYVMNDFMKQDTENTEHGFFNDIKLTTDFPASGKDGFYIYSMNDFAVISEDQSVCEDIVAQNKLGNTLSTDQAEMKAIFGMLPARVTERTVNNSIKFSRTVYRNRIHETHISLNSEDSGEEGVSAGESLTINIDAVIKDFISFDGKGNVSVLTGTNELMYYSGGQMKWIKNLGSKAVDGITYLDQFQFLLVTCKNSIHLLDKQGNYVLGGPVNLGGRSPSQQATVFNWRNKLYLVFPDENGTMHLFDQRGRHQFSVANSMTGVSAPVDAWISQKRLFFGVRNNGSFKMFDAEKRSEYRSFNLPGDAQSIVRNNEIFLFSSENGELIYMDQKGGKTQLNESISGKIKKSSASANLIYLSNFNSGKISILSSVGSLLGIVPIDFSDVENWHIQTIDGRTFVGVIDGLENNVYLYELDGAKFSDRSYEGSRKCMLNNSDNTLIITSIVDKFIVQHRVN